MGAKLTGTLVAANLVAVSGLAGLQLYGAIQSLDAEAATPQIAFLASADQPVMTTAALYPAHPVRVMTRGSNADPGPPILVTLAGPTTVPEAAPAPTSNQPSTETPPLAAAQTPDTQPETPAVAQVETRAVTMAEAAEDLGRITTAAGPAHAMSSPTRAVQGSPQEAWQASPRLQVAYRARLIEANPGPAANTETVTSRAATPKTAAQKTASKSTARKSATSGAAGETAAPFMARLMAPGAPGATGYVIVASYGTRESATVEAARLGHWQPTIVPAKVKGKDYFRVAIGPFTKADLQPALKAVISDGAAKAWPLIIKPETAAAKAE